MFPSILSTFVTQQLTVGAAFNQTIFHDFHNLLDIRTIVLYNDQNQWPALVEYLPEDCAHVVITQDVPWKLKEYFGELVLSVVFVRAEGNAPIFRILQQTMQHWHLKYVLFISLETLEPLAKWRTLFRWCHVRGFFNTLLMDVDGSIVAFGHFLGQQVFRTNLKDFLDYRSHLSNFHGFPIRATLGNNPPRALVWYDAHDTLHLSGYYGKVLSLFASHYNASLDFVILSHLEYYSEFECLEYIGQHKADLCGDAMPMSSDYITTAAEEISQSFLIVPYDKPLDRFYYFLKPFQLEVWLLLAFCLLYKTLTLAALQRRQGHAWDVGLNALNSLLALLNLSFQLQRLQGWRRKFLEFIMFVTGFVVANWYLSILSSVLFSRLYTDYINSLEDLVSHNISIMISEGEQFVLNASDISPLISRQLRLVDNEQLWHHRRNLMPSFAYYSQYDKNYFYLHQQRFMLRPRMKELSHIPINPVYAGMPMRANWPLQDKLNSHMRYMIDSGIYLRLMSDTNDDGIRMGYLKYFPTEHQRVEPLGVEYFQMAGVLLAVGFLLATVSFALELLMAWKI